MPNRLNLDFSIGTDKDRIDFINNYIQKVQNFTEEELETMANYILWGRDENGKNAVQRKEVEIQTRHSTWSKQTAESLDALTESPNFNDAIIRKPTKAVPKIPIANFDRADALAKCPDDLKPTLESLFKKIDHLDCAILYYELAHGKKTTPIRPELLNRIDSFELPRLEKMAASWNQRVYLKQKHYLVELRREQYALRDLYAQPVVLQKKLLYEYPEQLPEFGIDIPVRPLGIFTDDSPLFQNFAAKDPSTKSEEELRRISSLYWEFQNETDAKFVFDFRNKSLVTQLLRHIAEAQLDFERRDNETSFAPFLRTINFYIERANLSPILREVLNLKMRRVKNPEIQKIIKEKYGKNYGENYMSTIFHQQVIPRICAAAEYHEKEVASIFFPELFKKCKNCGNFYLIDDAHFTKRSRAKDGYSTICKKCEKEKRDRR